MLVSVDAAQPRPAITLPDRACIRELWEWRGLWLTFLRRDLRLRYRRSVLAFAWLVLQPLAGMVVFAAVFGRIGRIGADGVPYRLFVLVGLTFWIFVRGALTASAGSVVAQSSLVTRVYFPRLLLPLSAIAGRLIDFALGLGVVLAVLAVSGRLPGRGIWLAVPALAVALVLVTGLAMAAAAANVRFRQVGAGVPAVMQLWMFLSPVIYPASLVPVEWRGWYRLNPMVGILEAFRAAMLGQPAALGELAYPALAAVAIFTVGFSIFRWMEDEFADRL
ncbi:MAG TPA: ABC transporter permease [Longimicrobium sp.]|jgi:lipopolysaccharide transport system permease protein